MNRHFCSCPVEQCPQHPGNHGMGCDPCVQDNLEKKKMPACFFNIVHDDVSEVTDFTIDGFIKFYHEHNEK